MNNKCKTINFLYLYLTIDPTLNNKIDKSFTLAFLKINMLNTIFFKLDFGVFIGKNYFVYSFVVASRRESNSKSYCELEAC